tara:strand:+ start:637 stop:1413 length:777 start_codon:yes stop_codon:yes gene_type:complete
MINIHKTTIIHKGAQIADDVKIGPFCNIENDVIIKSGTVIHSHVSILEGSIIGKNNIIHSGSVIGGNPQDLKFHGEKTKLIIGDNNVIREYCTLNKGTDFSDKTVIGSNCLLMAYVHVAHDCVVEDKVILANGVQLGGHSEIGYHATVGGVTPVHQFCKVGMHAFIGGGRVVLQDVPPYILATGEPVQYSGINSVGLRRRNFNQDTRTLIKKVYSLIYRSKLNTMQAINEIKERFNDKKSIEINNIIEFIENSERGII